MKGDWASLPGRTIQNVLVAELPTAPQHRVVFVFSDGTYFEVYTSEAVLRGTSSVYPGDLEHVLDIYTRDCEWELFSTKQ